MRAALYARVSTLDQEPENQLAELRRYAAARGWEISEYVDHGVSGSQDRRRALDALLRDARRRRVDVLVCWRLDRLGRNLRHLVTLLDELHALGVAFVSLGEGIDCTTPAGRLQLHVLAALAEFERSRIAERVRAGLARAKANGKRLGRPKGVFASRSVGCGSPPLDEAGGSAAACVGVYGETLAEVCMTTWKHDLAGGASAHHLGLLGATQAATVRVQERSVG